MCRTWTDRFSLAAVGGNSTGTGAGDQGKKKGNAGVGGEHGGGLGVTDLAGAGAGNGLDGLDGLDGGLECCTLEEVRAWGSSFDKLMRSAAGRKLFREFLVSEYSEENIAFWLACEQLKRESNPETIEEKARYIYEDYISILSPKEVSRKETCSYSRERVYWISTYLLSIIVERDLEKNQRINLSLFYDSY